MAGTFVLANAAHAFWVDAPERHSIERLTPEPLHDLVVEAVVLPVEAALKLGSRSALEVQPSRRLARHLGHERRPFVDGLRAQPHP